MKKLLLSLLLFSAAATTATAQVEIGLQLSPSITSLRADSPADHSFTNDGAKLNFGGGLVVDYFFGENYAFSTGLMLVGKGGTIAYKDADFVSSSIQVKKQEFSTQYLELPVGVKLFTNEVAPDIRLYFKASISVAIPIGTRINGDKYYQDNALDPTSANYETKSSSHVFFFDSNASLGLGAEYQLGKSTKAFGGFSYHRGLVDTDSYFENKDKRNFSDVTIKNSSFALDVGLKF